MGPVMLLGVWHESAHRVPHAIAHGVRLLEAGLLGRGHAPARRVVEHAIRLGADRAWCMRCGASLAESIEMPAPVAVGQGPACDVCRYEPAFDGFVRLGRYDSPLGALARRVKRHAWHRAAELLGVKLALEVRARLVSPGEGWCVVPIPGALMRRLARGIDHTRCLSRALAVTLDVPMACALSVGRSSRQAGLGRDQRLARTARMRLRTGRQTMIRGRCVLLVDDVRTTGSTLFEARELLASAGASAVVPSVVCVADLRKHMSEMDLRGSPRPAAGPESRKLVHNQNPLKEGC